MANDLSTIQSLKAVDSWIDVINANINGGVRTAFKSSRLRFAGTNTMLDRAPTSTTLPLQLPEPGLITANTVIDFSQGAITSSTEITHLAIQGEHMFFVVASPDMIGTDGRRGAPLPATGRLYLTRDGEFHTRADGLLVNAAGYLLVCAVTSGGGLSATGGQGIRAVYNDLEGQPTSPTVTEAIKLSAFLQNTKGDGVTAHPNALAGGGTWTPPSNTSSLVQATQGQQALRYTSLGSTVFDSGYRVGQSNGFSDIRLSNGMPADASILSKSLEASNSSMTQSVPELSLAQKLFSALTKVLQIGQTNTDSVLNLVR